MTLLVQLEKRWRVQLTVDRGWVRTMFLRVDHRGLVDGLCDRLRVRLLLRLVIGGVSTRDKVLDHLAFNGVSDSGSLTVLCRLKK